MLAFGRSKVSVFLFCFDLSRSRLKGIHECLTAVFTGLGANGPLGGGHRCVNDVVFLGAPAGAHLGSSFAGSEHLSGL